MTSKTKTHLACLAVIVLMVACKPTRQEEERAQELQRKIRLEHMKLDELDRKLDMPPELAISDEARERILSEYNEEVARIQAESARAREAILQRLHERQLRLWEPPIHIEVEVENGNNIELSQEQFQEQLQLQYQWEWERGRR